MKLKMNYFFSLLVVDVSHQLVNYDQFIPFTRLLKS